MLDMTLYEVLELTHDEEGNIASKEFPNTPRGLLTANHSERFKERTSKVFGNVVEYDEWSDAIGRLLWKTTHSAA